MNTNGPKGTLFLHKGAREVTVEQLEGLPTPEETRTYKPVPHAQLVRLVKRVAERNLPMTLHQEQYGLTKDNLRLFGVHTYKVDGYENEGLSVAFRQGLDRKMPVQGCAGQQTFICDNMAISGGLMHLRRHTGPDIEGAVEHLFNEITGGSVERFKHITMQTDTMRDIPVDDDRAWELTGLLEGHGVITPKAKKIILHDWNVPRFREFSGRNLYSYYNCVTQGLKSLPESKLIGAHSAAHKTLVERCL
jgi:hypothetical protein